VLRARSCRFHFGELRAADAAITDDAGQVFFDAVAREMNRCVHSHPDAGLKRAIRIGRRVARQKAPADSIMRVWGMHERIQIELSAADRAELKTIVPIETVLRSMSGGPRSSC
jgi:hypothetical protein